MSRLRAKEQSRLDHREVGLAVDFDDVRAFVPEEDRPAFAAALRELPVDVVVVRDEIGDAQAAMLRDAGFRLLWRLDDGADSKSFPALVGANDGVVVAGEYALENPGIAEAVAASLKNRDGFLAVVEFSPRRALLHLPRLVPGRLIRTHILTTRETVNPKPELWLARLTRAADDRAVRLVCFRFSSSWSAKENLSFLRSLVRALAEDGHSVGRAAPLPPWPAGGAFAGWGALALACLAPAAAVAAAALYRGKGAIVPFTVITAFSAFTGLIVHGLIATPAAVTGVAAARGVKLQLVVPLALALALLLDVREIRAFARRRVTWGDLLGFGGVAAAVLAVYLMRSGNDPLLPVTDAERHLRDWLEAALGARPRFKEFAIGHPLLIAGLYLRRNGGGFWRDGRALMAAGLIGQISIVNTFVHAAAPVSTSLLRTIHGWWIGALISVPLCHVLARWTASAPARRRMRADA